ASQIAFVDKPGKIAIADAVPTLIESLKDNDGDVRGLAALTLGVIGPSAKAAVPALTQALRHADPVLRAEVAFALGGMGDAAKSAVGALSDALKKDRDNTVRVFAGQAVYQIEPQRAAEVVPALIAVLDDRDANVRARAAAALGAMREKAKDAVPALNDALKDANPSLRLAAATALGKIGTPARVTYPTLDQLAKDDQPEIRKAASESKKKIGAPQKSDVALLLIPGLKHANPRFRTAAAVCLWMLDRDAREAVGPLSEALADPDETVRGTAAFALAAIGADAAEAVPALLKALKSQGDDSLRARAAYALGEIGAAAAKKAVEPLKLALNDRSAMVRLHAAQALWSIEPKAEDVLPALTRLLEEKELESGLLIAAVETLTKIGA